MPRPDPSRDAHRPLARVVVPPAPEVRALQQALPDLLGPADGRGSALGSWLRTAMVAPVNQLSFANFEQQAYGFQIFHTRRIVRLVHLVGMHLVVLLGMVVAADATSAWAGVDGAACVAAALGAWYAAVSARRGLALWWWVMAADLVALWGLAHLLTPWLIASDAPWWLSPWVGMAATSFLLSAVHGLEPRMPPRTGDAHRWVTVRAFLTEPGLTARERLARVGKLSLFPIWGMLNEWWSSPRLLPYTVLMEMLERGYAPAMAVELGSYLDAAMVEGQPALDYIGPGGGTFLHEAQGAPAHRAAYPARAS